MDDEGEHHKVERYDIEMIDSDSSDSGTCCYLPSLPFSRRSSPSTGYDQYFILLKDVDIVQTRAARKKKGILQKGSVVNSNIDPSRKSSTKYIELKDSTLMKSVKHDKIRVECIDSDVASITNAELFILLGVASTKDRLKIFEGESNLFILIHACSY